MPDAPAYAIVGRGRWAQRMHVILQEHGRQTSSVGETRRESGEPEDHYRSRMTSALAATKAQIAWLCLPPGPHIPIITEAAITAGLHVIAEKPWLVPPAETQRLINLAQSKQCLVGLHHEYCFLTEVAQWRQRFQGTKGLLFGGTFYLGRGDHTGIPAIENLGSHLLAIREFAVPQSELGLMFCAYERPDQRRVWLEKDGAQVAALDLLAHREPIIQKFVDCFERAPETASFPLDLRFAMRVAAALAAARQ